MENFLGPRDWMLVFLVGLLISTSGIDAKTQDANLPAGPIQTDISTNSASPVSAAPIDAEQQLRSHLRLQEQLHSTLLAIEQARKESSEETQTNAGILSARLELLERSLTQHRELQLESLHSSQQTTLLVIGGMVGVGLLALMLTLIFQSRGMNRLAEAAAAVTHHPLLTGPMTPSLSFGEQHLLLGNSPGGESSSALFATIDRLEQRIRELEHTTVTPLLSGGPTESNSSNGHSGRNGASRPRPVDHVSVLLSKGQVLLNLGQTENALACFEEAAASSPDDPQTHLRRGAALEKLKRHTEALACYQRAIELDRSLTQAYLGKGGVFNAQERYAEALECYEQALASEKKV